MPPVMGKQTMAISRPVSPGALLLSPLPTLPPPPKNPRQAPVSQEERGLWNPKTIVFGGAAM